MFPYSSYYRLQEMKRSGLVDRINKQIWPDETNDAVQDAEPNVTLGTTAVFFVILSAGVVLSVLVLLVEILWYRLTGSSRGQHKFRS
jgi:hypothetical protein